MKVKIDTKEKMQIIKLKETNLAANMSEDLGKMLRKYLDESVSNVIICFGEVEEMDEGVANKLLEVQQAFYENGHSMVFCEISKKVEEFLEQKEILELMNVTPTESEAWDIVQMEEIERELL